MPILPFADLILSVFPVAWVFGRSGCSVVHDHPGMKADRRARCLAVAFGPPERIQKIVSFGAGISSSARATLRSSISGSSR